jgi:hypothetical protein
MLMEPLVLIGVGRGFAGGACVNYLHEETEALIG